MTDRNMLVGTVDQNSR